ncbi:MAG: hypothetical protein ACLVFZ_01840 [Parasutterella sp.]|uniref:hypothetical protein n=1 Tax=Parasutterella sp. TaxID=2049037 RepID=UPI00399B9C16
MLIDAIKQHGKKQIEVKQKIRITDKTKKLKYRVDTFFIFPSALQITENNFKKEEIKHNLKCYLSLSEQSPSLSGLRNELSELRLSPGQEEESDDFYRRFCLKYKTALQESSRSLMENQELSVEETEAFLQTVNKLLEEFRKIKSSQENSDHLVQLLDKLDEYLTVVTAFCLRDLSEVCIGEPRNKILSFWQEVEKYRASRFPVESIEGESKESAFLMRWSFLKKFVQSSLFLDIRYKQGAPLLTHSIYGSAAALSMLFATVVAFFYQDRYGSLSRNLFFALVIAYIFKDRFKEIVRDWLSNVIFRRWIPDRRLFIFLGKKKVGCAKENFDFVSLNELPISNKDILQEDARLLSDCFRQSKLTPYACDSIFRYIREITLSASEFPDEACLIDIIRFNISEFLHNLGATSEGLPFFCDNGKSPKGEKLYNIYLFRSFCVGEKSDSEVIRVTVNAKAVRRISIVKSFENGISVLENRGKFIYT